jgi:hypothetical protein
MNGDERSWKRLDGLTWALFFVRWVLGLIFFVRAAGIAVGMRGTAPDSSMDIFIRFEVKANVIEASTSDWK